MITLLDNGTGVSATNPMPVSGTVTVSSLPAITGAVTATLTATGATAAQHTGTATNAADVVIPALAGRRYLLIENTDGADSLLAWLAGSTTGGTVGRTLGPGDAWELDTAVWPGAIALRAVAADATYSVVEY